MERMISYCGLYCDECPAYKATLNDDDEMRAKTAAEWSAQFKVELKPENIDCVGCTVKDGAHFHHWTECGIRKCASEHGLENCGHCKGYACDQLAELFKMVPAAKATLDELRKELQAE